MSTLAEVRERSAREPEQREQEDTSGWNICYGCSRPIRSGHLSWQDDKLIHVCDECEPPPGRP